MSAGISYIYRSLSFAIKTPFRTSLSSSTARSITSSSPSSFAQKLRMPSSVQQFVDGKISDNKIVVFSKTHCPYCRETKQYFKNNYPSEAVEVVELDTRDDGSEIQDYLLIKTKGRSVPRTFINGEFVGGNDTLQATPKDKVDAWIAKSA